MTDYDYGTVDGVKERVLEPIANDQYDDEIESALKEASEYINMRLSPYEKELPLTEYDPILDRIAEDIGSGVFKRRQTPLAMEGATWWGQGIAKLDAFILATYKRGIFWFSEDLEED